ncbi:MAG: argininosuccinate lyase [Flavobacteriaceae bacterium]|nr:argininosuccinate lyase [Flavobacteriaceae bacterium]
MKLWQKDNKSSSELIEKFTVGNDKELDLVLAEFDVKGSLAHTQMLESIGLLTKEELQLIHSELHLILNEIKLQNFKIEDGVEDIHSQIELMLTQRIGETGKKIHSGRSRNDQVLTDIKLYLRFELKEIVQLVEVLFKQLIALSETHKDKLLPGYTHLQIAMPSSFGLWFGAYAESLVDDMELVVAAYNVTNKNPLGSGAGYGSSFPLNREMTTELLEFDSMNYNVVYAQMSRGKTEKIVAMAISSIAATLSKLAFDICLYMNQNFGFVTFPDELTTGSSIMPHKKNPDVFELIRAKCNKLQALPNELTILTNNLPSGYHRDMQLTKESLFPAINQLKSCLEMTAFMLQHIQVKETILQDEKYTYLFSVEAVNEQVIAGIPFRDAYKNVGVAIENNSFNPSMNLNHTHAGSIGNLCNDKIIQQMEVLLDKIQK